MRRCVIENYNPRRKDGNGRIKLITIDDNESRTERWYEGDNSDFDEIWKEVLEKAQKKIPIELKKLWNIDVIAEFCWKDSQSFGVKSYKDGVYFSISLSEKECEEISEKVKEKFFKT